MSRRPEDDLWLFFLLLFLVVLAGLCNLYFAQVKCEKAGHSPGFCYDAFR